MVIDEYRDINRELFFNDIIPRYRPCVFRGLCSAWPLVKKGRESSHGFAQYLLESSAGHHADVVDIFYAPPGADGRMHYNDAMNGFNFNKLKVPFSHCLERLLLAQRENPSPLIYMGSTPTEDLLPRLKHENPMTLLGNSIKPRLWLGGKTLVQPHYDVSDNIAVVVAGRRRFTLFPPDQIGNLYVGPIDVTPAGQPMSLVPINTPDLQKFPRYAEAQKNKLVVELEPGDAIFIPSLWWHGVEGLDSFNGLVNYWWKSAALANDDPYAALIHGVLTISSLPEPERHAWKAFFDHYVFQEAGHPLDHLPESARGVLSTMTPELQQLIRSYLYARMGIR